MLPLLALVSEAHALRVACNTFDVSAAVPMTGAENVPVDARPAAVFVKGCGGSSAWMASLARADDGVDIAFGVGEDLDLSLLLEVFPEADLEPLTAYTVSLGPLDGEAVAVGFVTGTGRVTGLDGTPTVTVEQAGWDRDSDEITVALLATPVADPDALSILQVKDGAINRGVQSFAVPATGTMPLTLVWTEFDRPDEVCPQVRQLDGAGVATEWSAPACVAITSCGCGSTGPATGLLGLGLALGLVIRRRA